MSTDVATALDTDNDHMTPVKWDDWVNLPVRPQDQSIKTPLREIRVPSVIITVNYGKVHMKAPVFGPKAVKARDSYTCQYCGNVFESNGLNLDHVTPREKGGPTTWDNIVASCYACNGKKANKLPQEAGMFPLRKPSEPKPLPPSSRIKNTYSIAIWDHFLTSKS